MSITVSERIVVAGSSLAGLRTIEALRQRGYAGEIVALSAEPHMPYNRPPLSKQFLKGDWDEDRLTLRRDGYDDLGVDWRLGVRAESLDPAERVVGVSGGERIAYGGLVVATGCAPRQLPGAEGLAGVHLLRGLDDARRLRDALSASTRLVVIGAGFIGMEVAATAREVGAEVAVVEALAAPLLRGLGEELGELVGARHRDHGVDLRCGVGVSGFEGGDRVAGVKLADGTLLEADEVVVGIGVSPETDWLAGSGIEVDDGVLCDARGATSLPDVVAAGDVARWHSPRYEAALRYEHWTSAVEQAPVAAARLLEGPDAVPPLDQVPYVWSDQFDMRLAIAGEPAGADARHVTHGALDEDRFLVLCGRAGRLVGAVACRRPRQLNACMELIQRGAGFDEAVAEIG